MKTGKKKKQGRSLMFSSQLFVYIFSASFLLLVVGLLVLYRVSSNAATKINNEIKRATLEISGENLNREFAHMDDIVRAVFLQQDILNCLTQDLGRTPSAYMSVRKAILSASANDNTICSMGIYDTLDAAAAYGDSEQVIGQWLRAAPEEKRPFITTKLKTLDHSSLDALRRSVNAQLEHSMQQLGLSCAEPRGESLYRYLQHPQHGYRPDRAGCTDDRGRKASVRHGFRLAISARRSAQGSIVRC